MKEIKRTFTMEKETKNTYRFQEDKTPGEPTTVGILYVQSYLFDKRPQNISMTLTFED